MKEFITLHMEQDLLSKVLQKEKEKNGSLSDLIIQFFRWVVQDKSSLGYNSFVKRLAILFGVNGLSVFFPFFLTLLAGIISLILIIGGGVTLYLNYESDKSDMDDTCNTNISTPPPRRTQLFFSNIGDFVPSKERTALIAFYNNTDGDNWTDNSGWKTPPLYSDGFAMPGTEGSWFGNRE